MEGGEREEGRMGEGREVMRMKMGGERVADFGEGDEIRALN